MSREHGEHLRSGSIPVRIGDGVMAPSAFVAGAPASRRGDLVTPAGFCADLPNRAPARAPGLNPRAVRRSHS